MTKYITFREKDDKGELQYYILQRDFPHYVGLISNAPKESVLMQAPIAGHYLWVVFSGTLRGNMIPAYQEIYKEIESVFTNMSEWYYINRIKPNEKKYKKFKIQSNVPIGNQ